MRTIILFLTLIPSALLATDAAVLDTIQTSVPALKDVFANDFAIGCLLSYRHVGFASDPVVPGQSSVVDPNGGYLIKYHMNNMSPGNNMKPENTLNIAGSAAAYTAATTQTERDSIDVHPIVRFNSDMTAQLNWAQRQGFTFRGHTLVWHAQTPAAFFYVGYSTSNVRLTKARMTERLRNYVRGIIRLLHESWPGMVTAMDVVNEAVTDGGGQRTTSEWYLTFGDDSYIATAFEITRQATAEYGETQMKLYYNDYNTHLTAKAGAIAALCAPIAQVGNLDGIGMQDHDQMTTPTAAQWIASYNTFAAVCSEIAVTEIDISTGSGTNSPSASVLASQANQYGQLFKCFVERSARSGRGKIVSVSKDGLNDVYTFVTNQSSSLWNSANQCKPAFFAVVNVGRSYNALDSLLTHAAGLSSSMYTPATWATLTSAISSATTARDQNYSYTFSADTTLGNAVTQLTAAINGLVTGVGDRPDVPDAFVLRQNYPNPFNPATVIGYRVPEDGASVRISIHDPLGREVALLVDGVVGSGDHQTTWDASGMPSGAYICRFVAGGVVHSAKMMLVR